MPELFHRKIERTAIGFVIAIIAAASVGGMLFLIGTLVGCYNIWMTVRDETRPVTTAPAGDVPARQPAE